jgi:cobalt-zinc-cadmium efflux system outer membrane protein
MTLAGLFCLMGCVSPVGQQVDATVCELGSKPWDLEPLAHTRPDLPPAVPELLPPPAGAATGPRLTVPEDFLPGGNVPDIKLPRAPRDDDPQRAAKEEARRQAVARLFPALPPVGEEPVWPPGPEGRALTLSDLQALALTNSPLVKQATARLREAQGAALQAGLPPNPTVGYEGDTIGTQGGFGYQGGFIEQKMIVSNKLQLARAAAAMDMRNAELALFRAQTDVAREVRGNYFGVLVAEESVRTHGTLVRFTSALYDNQVKQLLRGGIAASYEPMYLRALATQARGSLVLARNRRTSAWKQLAASMGLPGYPPTRLAGRLDVPVPVFDHKEVLAWVLAHHTDVKTAENLIQQAQYNVQHARATPIPDPTFRFMLQKDRTGPPYEVAPSFQVSIPLAVWDRNQGNILTAEGALVRQSEEPHRVRAELTRTLADAFERYENSRVLLGYYRDQILPDLVRVYRGVLSRYRGEALPPPRVGDVPLSPLGSPTPGFNDLVVAQQNLATAVNAYVTTLGQLWQAVVDVADLLQTRDLFKVHTPTEAVPAIPDLDRLCPLPCPHPCSPLPGAHQHVPDAGWPAAEPAPAKNPE